MYIALKILFNLGKRMEKYELSIEDKIFQFCVCSFNLLKIYDNAEL